MGGEPTFRLEFNDLRADTHYRFRYQAHAQNGVKSLERDGQFKTFVQEKGTYTFLAASCHENGSNSKVFSHMMDHKADFMINMGDFFYSNYEGNETEVFWHAYRE